MKTITFAAAAALTVFALPAQAQLIGGGGLGGGLGGGVGGVLGGSGSASSSMGGLPRIDRSSIGSIGSVDATGEARASKKVDRRSGKVDASGSGSAQGNGALGQTLDTPFASATGSSSASGSASGSGSASAQLIGTDQVRQTVGGARDRAAQAVGTARDRTGGAMQGVRDRAGNALGGVGSAAGSANGSGSGSGSASGNAGFLALAGSAAGQGSGAFEITKGTTLFDMNGEKLGKVREVVADGRGKVRELIVKVDGETARLPSSAFSTDGSLLLTAMSEAQIKSVADQQDAAQKAQ